MAFNVINWSIENLDTEVVTNIKKTHNGKFGEKLQKSLFKIMNKEDLLNWYNKKFEIGLVSESLEDFNKKIVKNLFL